MQGKNKSIGNQMEENWKETKSWFNMEYIAWKERLRNHKTESAEDIRKLHLDTYKVFCLQEEFHGIL